MALFCLSLASVMRQAAPCLTSAVSYVSIQDDTYLVGNAACVIRAWPHLTAYLAIEGHETNQSKSECWVPALDSVATLDLPRWLSDHFSLVSRAIGGIKALGTVA